MHLRALGATNKEQHVKNPRMLVVGAVAAASLMAAASASAAADVSSVTVEQAGKRKLEVVVETVHGASAGSRCSPRARWARRRDPTSS